MTAQRPGPAVLPFAGCPHAPDLDPVYCPRADVACPLGLGLGGGGRAPILALGGRPDFVAAEGFDPGLSRPRAASSSRGKPWPQGGVAARFADGRPAVVAARAGAEGEITGLAPNSQVGPAV
jgi:hypothetical protein